MTRCTNSDLRSLLSDTINGIISLLTINGWLNCLIISSLFNWFDVIFPERRDRFDFFKIPVGFGDIGAAYRKYLEDLVIFVSFVCWRSSHNLGVKAVEDYYSCLSSLV
jgi:hypothetical protein